MDAAHLHLILVHIPIVGLFIGLSILAYGLLKKNDETKRIALVIFVLAALITIAVFFTGDEAEGKVGHLPGVSSEIIDEHEDLAGIAIWVMELLGILALGSLYAMNKRLSYVKTLIIVTFLLSIATFGLFAQVGNLGGQIRHSEIRTGAGTPIGSEVGNEGYFKKDDDDH